MEVLKVTPEDRRTLVNIARSLRRRADQTEPKFSTRQIIDACYPGTIVTGRRLRYGLEEVVKVDRKAFRTHRAPHIIVYNRDLPTDQQRYAIAHALGHVIFDGGERIACDKSEELREERCDRFADELLVPLDELKPYVCAWPSKEPERHETYLDMCDEIASHFHVPRSVIERRIAELRPRRRRSR